MIEIVKTPAQVVGEILKHIRKRAKLSQKEVAKHLGYDTRGSISHFETGIRRISLWEFVEFCRACKQDPADVMQAIIKSVPGSFFPTEGEAN